MLALNAVIQSNSLEISERPRWDLNPRITDLQSVPLGHLGTRPRPYPCTERLWRQRNEHFNLQIFWNHFRSGDFFASPDAPCSSANRTARHRGATSRLATSRVTTRCVATSRLAISRVATRCAAISRLATSRATTRCAAIKHIKNYGASTLVARRRVPNTSPWITRAKCRRPWLGFSVSGFIPRRT